MRYSKQKHALISFVVAYLSMPALSQVGGIQGKVLDATGSPVNNATVYAVNENHMDAPPVTGVTNEQGDFTLSKVPTGQVYINASRADTGRPYSIFAFYNLPGEDKPKVIVSDERTTEHVVVRLGESVAYLNLKVVNENEQVIPARLVFARSDQPGMYKRSFAGQGEVPVPPVPLSLSIVAEGYAEWHLTAPNGAAVVRLKSGEHLEVIAELTPVRR